MTDLIAFYGSLRRGARDPRAPSSAGLAVHVGPCRLAGRLVRIGRYPALVPGGRGVVAADLFRIVSPRALALFDAWEDFDPHRPAAGPYRRVRLTPIGDDRPVWVYVRNRKG
jgi:gamma-glutamylcyclotransferase (GGCT)/AIG2-like uncharacterized protein YtfP